MYIINFFLEYIVSFALLILILVFVHEMGHFLFARLCGVKVEVFSIGFGKEILGFTDKKKTRWKIAPIPLGGYVKMKGEMLPTDEPLDNDKDSFHNKNLLQKILIVFAGPLFNLVFPIIIFLAIPIIFGVPTLKPKVYDVVKGSPAEKVLQRNDYINKINGHNISSFDDLIKIISINANKKIDIEVLRNNKIKDLQLKVAYDTVNGDKVGFIGIKADETAIFYKKLNFVDCIKTSFILYERTILNILYGFKLLFTGKVHSGDLGGPIKIAKLSGTMIKDGLPSWLFFLGSLSINLAIVNLIPIPGLDGGHLFIYLIQVITRRKIPAKIQNTLIMLGFFMLLTLIVLISLNDIIGLFR